MMTNGDMTALPASPVGRMPPGPWGINRNVRGGINRPRPGNDGPGPSRAARQGGASRPGAWSFGPLPRERIVLGLFVVGVLQDPHQRLELRQVARLRGLDRLLRQVVA